jgi:hypothetical protein
VANQCGTLLVHPGHAEDLDAEAVGLPVHPVGSLAGKLSSAHLSMDIVKSCIFALDSTCTWNLT